jgi:hypothetical protein
VTERPALEHLMKAYFHPDWRDDGTVWDVVDLFAFQESELAQDLPHEISGVLEAIPSEDELKNYVSHRLGSYYVPDVHGSTYREWLTQIAERVRAATS